MLMGSVGPPRSLRRAREKRGISGQPKRAPTFASRAIAGRILPAAVGSSFSGSQTPAGRQTLYLLA
jgi:hypothetical protein